jgi:hypothetical protein
MVLKLTRDWERQKCSSNYGCKISTLQTATMGPTADAEHQPCKVEANKGAIFQPCKVKEQVELRGQDFNLAKLKQTRASNKQQTSEKAPRGPTVAA